MLVRYMHSAHAAQASRASSRRAPATSHTIFCALIVIDGQRAPRLVSDGPVRCFHKYAAAESHEAAEDAVLDWCLRVGLRPEKLHLTPAFEQDPSRYERPDQFIRAR